MERCGINMGFALSQFICMWMVMIQLRGEMDRAGDRRTTSKGTGYIRGSVI